MAGRTVAPLVALALAAAASSFAALAAPPSAPAPAQAKPSKPAASLLALLDRCVAAHGGAEALSRADAFRLDGHVTSLLHPGAQGKISRVYSRPDRLRVEVAWPGEPTEVRVLEGTRGFRNGVPVQGPLFTSMLLQLVRLDLPWLLHQARAAAVDRGEVRLGTRTLRAVEIPLGDGLSVTAEIDPQTGLIARSRTSGRATGPGAPPLEFSTTYEEYRAVEGVQISFREGNWANGRDTGVTTVEVVAVGSKTLDPGAAPAKSTSTRLAD